MFLKRSIAAILILSAFFAGITSYAQKPVQQPKSSSSAVSGRAYSREIHNDEKKQELCKKLMQRKSELRREDRVKEVRTAPARDKEKDKD